MKIVRESVLYHTQIKEIENISLHCISLLKNPPKTVGYRYDSFLAVYIGTGVAAGIVLIIVVLVLTYFIRARKK